MSIPHYKNNLDAKEIDFISIFYWTEEEIQKCYLIDLIKNKTPEPEKGIMQLIETDELKNIELAYLLTYPNEES